MSNKKGAASRPQKVKKGATTIHSTPQDTPQDWYTVNGVRYIREDLVNNPMVAVMERIAIAQETQSAFYDKYDKMMSPMIDTYMKTIAEQIEAMKKMKGNPFKSNNHPLKRSGE